MALCRLTRSVQIQEREEDSKEADERLESKVANTAGVFLGLAFSVWVLVYVTANTSGINS